MAVSDKHLYVWNNKEHNIQSTLIARPLPVISDRPMSLAYDTSSHSGYVGRILGPLTHGHRTVNMAVSRIDSRIVAVTAAIMERKKFF